jgi:curved DNA-binding protein
VRVRISLEDAYLGAERNLQLQAEPLGGGSRSRTLRVKIPSGVTNGQQIRLSGQGAPGVKGGRAGNLFLQVELLPHPVYRVEGKDLHMDLPVSPWEAALGATIKIPTLGGNKDLKVPAGSQSGRTLRLRGRGLGQAQKGDLYVRVQIVTPAADTPEAKALYQKMASELAFNPRAKLNV